MPISFVRAAFYCALGMVIISYPVQYFKISFKGIEYLHFILLIPFIYFPLKELTQTFSGNSYRIKGILRGTGFGILTGLIFAAWHYSLLKWIQPSLLFGSIDTPALRAELKAEGLNEEEILTTIRNMGDWVPPGLQAASLFVLISILSFIIAFIMVLVVIKQKPITTMNK